MAYLKYAALGSLALLSGCDPGYLVKRNNHSLNEPASIDCVKQAIESIPGNKITRDGLTRHPFVCGNGLAYRIEYLTELGTIGLEACYEGEKLKSFSQAQGGLPTKPNLEKVPQLLARLRSTERAVENRCEVRGLTAGMKSNCTIARCD